MIEKTAGQRLTFDFDLDAPPEKVWRALTVPAFVDRWLTPDEPAGSRSAKTVVAEVIEADAPRRVHDAMPGHSASLRKRRKRVPDHPRVARQARFAGDLAVGRHAAPRNPGDHGVNACVGDPGRVFQAAVAGTALFAARAIGRPIRNMCASTPVIQTTGAGGFVRGGNAESGRTT